MADDNSAGEKSEQATPRKREEAREQGTVAKSQDLNTALLLLAAFLVLFFSFGLLLDQLAGVCIRSYTALSTERLDFDHAAFLLSRMRDFVNDMHLAAGDRGDGRGPGVFCRLGFTFSVKPLAPDPEPAQSDQGLQRILSKARLDAIPIPES